MLISDKKRFRSKKWTNDDLAKAMKIRCLSSKSLKATRNSVCPLPALPTLNAKFVWTHPTPGIIELSLSYLSRILPEMTEFQRLGQINFDELKTTNKGEYDRKFDNY